MTIRLSLGMYSSRGGPQLAEWAGRAVNVAVSSNEHGFEALAFDVAMPLQDRFRFYDQAATAHLVLGAGDAVVWEGRVEDREITAAGLRLRGFGYWSALFDVPYTALWSVTYTSQWRKLTIDEVSTAASEKYKMENNLALYIAPQKGEDYGNSGANDKRAYFAIQPPDVGSRQITGIQFDLEMDGSANWRFALQRRDANMGFVAEVFNLTGTGAAQKRSYFRNLTACDALSIQFFRNATSATFTGETGSTFVKLTNVRVVTSSTNRVDTTTTTTISAGSQVVTPASMTNIYVGQRLIIANGAATSESVVVTAVTATTFTATFVGSYSGTTTIQGHVIYGDEIVADLVAHITSINSDQLSASTGLIQSPGVDLLDELYEDELPGDIALALAARGDDSTPFEVGVLHDQMLFFRPKGANGKDWYIDLEVPVVNSTLQGLVNSVYGVYQDANGRTLRTAANDDDASILRYGVTRREALAVRTTSATQAQTHRDTHLADAATITPEGAVTVRRLYDAQGAPNPVWLAQPGDTITARNLPPTASSEIDKIRKFSVARMEFDADRNQATLTPERPLPQLEFLIARGG